MAQNLNPFAHSLQTGMAFRARLRGFEARAIVAHGDIDLPRFVRNINSLMGQATVPEGVCKRLLNDALQRDLSW